MLHLAVRLFPQQNPTCQRLACDHPLKGSRREGHFDMGMGPCKAPGCTCMSFQYTDPSLLLEMRNPSRINTRVTPMRMDRLSGMTNGIENSPQGIQGIDPNRPQGI